MNPDQPRTEAERRLTTDDFLSKPFIDPDLGKWGARLTAEQVNSPDFGVSLIETRSRELAHNRDAYARRLLEDRMPRFLRALIDRPRALKLLLRVVPRWRPTMTEIDLRQTTNRWGAEGYANVWLVEHGPIDGGLIFTYTDPSGLPAEVCGVE